MLDPFLTAARAAACGSISAGSYLICNDPLAELATDKIIAAGEMEHDALQRAVAAAQRRIWCVRASVRCPTYRTGSSHAREEVVKARGY